VNVFGEIFGKQYKFEYVKSVSVLYSSIEQKLRNKLHGPMYYKIGVTYVINEHVIYYTTI